MKIMSQGVFLNLSQGYISSAKNSFYYVGQTNLLVKPFAFIIAMIYSAVLVPVGTIFSLFIVLDWVGKAIDSIRKFLLELMETQSWSVNNSLFSFLFRPIFLVILAPLFLLSVFIPKLSSNSMVHLTVNEVSDIMSGSGAFKRVNEIIYRAAHRLFIYVSSAPLLLKPFIASIAIVYSIILIIVGAIFILLIPLDVLSKLIEGMRQGVVRFVDNQQWNIRYSGSAFLFTPLILVVLAPVFLAIILIPKFTTNLDFEVLK
jgi:hypothetical protein